MKASSRLRRFNAAMRKIAEADAKYWATWHERTKAEDGLMSILTKREARRVDWLRLDLNTCRQKVGKALDNKRGWEPMYDKVNKRWITILPYDKLPFLWRVVGHHFDYGASGDPDKEIRRIYHFRKDYIDRTVWGPGN